MALSSTEAVRSPAVAGMFYPGQPEKLRRDIDRMLAEAPAFPDATKIAAVIVPHAGYVYSGFTAAHAYRAVQGLQFDTVIAVGPSHREYFDYVSVYDGRAYATPLGIVEIDAQVRNALVQEGLVASNAGHRAEHSSRFRCRSFNVRWRISDSSPSSWGPNTRACARRWERRLQMLLTDAESSWWPARISHISTQRRRRRRWIIGSSGRLNASNRRN